jgi:hypothetical protein
MDVRLCPSVLSRFPRLDFRFRDIFVFYGERSSAPRPNLNLQNQGISFSLDHPLDLSNLGDPTRSYATAGIALRVI